MTIYCKKALGDILNTNGNNPSRIVPIHFRSTRRFSLVSDYGYSNWPIHPVSSTIFLRLERSRMACYSNTFKLFIRHLTRNCLPERSSKKATFALVFANPSRVKTLSIRRSSCFGFDEKKPEFLLSTAFLNQHLKNFFVLLICC